MKCTSKWGTNKNVDIVATSHNNSFSFDFGGIFEIFVILLKCLEKIYHGYKAMVVLYIYNIVMGIPFPGYPVIKNIF